jgi:hypothetical protein
MSAIEHMSLRVGPGDGLVARYGDVIVVMVSVGSEQRRVAGELLDLAREAPASGGDIGRTLSRRVAGVLSRENPDQVPPFCVVAPSGRGTVVVIHGDVDVVVSGPAGKERLSAANVATWVDRVIEEPLGLLTVVPARREVAATTLDHLLDLRDGVVSGGWVALVPPVMAPQPSEPAKWAPAERTDVEVASPPDEAAALPVDAAPETAPVEIPSPAAAAESPKPPDRIAAADLVSGHFVAVPLHGPELAGPDEERVPLPVAGAQPPAGELPADEGPGPVLVKGIRCSRGHFNHPESSYCAACGISMIHVTHNLVEGPRLPLGVIVFDDGATFTLDADYVIGREPDDDPAVRSGRARPLTIDDQDRSLSRVHAAIVLDGWDATIVDRGSTNGTSVTGPAANEWTRLTPEQPVPLVPGTRVLLGKRTLVFDSTLRRGAR